MQFLKLKTEDGCCTSQSNGEASVLEWCILDTDKIWSKLYIELNFEKYIPKHCLKNYIKKLQDAIFSKGRIQKNTKCNCKTVYLFQPLEQALAKSIALNETKIKTIEDYIETIDDDTHIFEFVKQNYKLPDWFIIYDWTSDPNKSNEESQKEFDEYENYSIWAEDFLMKNGKRIKEPFKNPLKKQNKLNKKNIKEVIVEDDKYIYSQSLYDAYMVLSDYLSYLNGGEMYGERTEEHVNKLLLIKISDYDWYSKWNIPDTNSNELLLKKIKE